MVFPYFWPVLIGLVLATIGLVILSIRKWQKKYADVLSYSEDKDERPIENVQ
ncbi:hypothetical protein HBHAL_2988 [Halobacillus halophilus DSM 2266]|uniref:Uncharacterized protein n=2 Tax=Halobacillus TaxID=45667 RepID=I0JMG5_HALH3|nr:hypothetical protein [Halobacillus halophilus]CCG45335.1 hypothetical protein HBHAL_2988 [Halobacillus halophilus DSM 2266]